MKEKVIKTVQLLISFLFVAAIIGVAIFPFDNRNLTVKFISDKEVYNYVATNVELAEERFDSYTFANTDDIILKKIQIYGRFRSVLLKEITTGELLNYIVLNDGNQEVGWTEEGLSLIHI